MIIKRSRYLGSNLLFVYSLQIRKCNFWKYPSYMPTPIADLACGNKSKGLDDVDVDTYVCRCAPWADLNILFVMNYDPSLGHALPSFGFDSKPFAPAFASPGPLGVPLEADLQGVLHLAFLPFLVPFEDQ